MLSETVFEKNDGERLENGHLLGGRNLRDTRAVVGAMVNAPLNKMICLQSKPTHI